jgi:hypothetical protein
MKNLKLSIDSESVNIYIDNGDDKEPTHIVYWHLDEVEEDASVAISIANAINLYHTNPKRLLTMLGYDSNGKFKIN